MPVASGSDRRDRPIDRKARQQRNQRVAVPYWCSGQGNILSILTEHLYFYVVYLMKRNKFRLAIRLKRVHFPLA
ncbi:hypothetical protein IQ252_09535 [Tychonema sp. LEGE 07203]|nr:hypothetical protein [Tychonema sp. LEGE 07203]